MTSRMVVRICDTAAQAAAAKGFLKGRGLTTITTSQVDVFNYDAATDAGGKSDSLANKFVVIGKTSS